MAGLSISGLSSGIDTTSVIQSLMTVAAQPQAALQVQLNNVLNEQSTYQMVNAKMAAVKAAADALANASTWAATKATSSDSSIVATGSSTALSGTSTTFSVTALAQSQTSTATVSDPDNAAVAANGLDLTIGGNTAHVDLTGSSASDVVSAINGANLGVRAALINVQGGGQVLQFTSTSSGADNSFDISGLSDSLKTMVAAQDASITVGDPANGGYTVTSNTNTFTDAIPGVTFTVSKLTTDPATISVSNDSTSISSAVQSLVSAVNSALGEIKGDTAQGAALDGDPTVNAITQQLLSVVSYGTSDGQTFADAGLDITSTGTVTFDATAFATAYAKDPTKIQSMLQNSLATGFSTVGANASDETYGSLTALLNTDSAQVTDLNKRISDWSTKLADQQTALTNKYAAMEAALSTMKSQSSFLTSAFASMTGQSSSSSSSTSS